MLLFLLLAVLVLSFVWPTLMMIAAHLAYGSHATIGRRELAARRAAREFPDPFADKSAEA